MATKNKKAKSETVLHLMIPSDVKDRIRKFRAKKQLNDEPITSDSSAILLLVDRGLEAELLNN